MTRDPVDRRDLLRISLGGVAAAIVPLSGEAKGAGDPVVLEARPGSAHLSSASPDAKAIWGYGGTVPGPLIRLRLGETVRARLVNRLAQPTTIHWHGVRNTNAMDGVAGLTQAPVRPGGVFDIAFTPPDAGLFWYHPQVGPDTPEQRRRGLHGVLIVDERERPKVDRDLLVVLEEWSLDAKRQVAQGGAGATFTVGGAPIPQAAVLRPGSRVRLRLLNACSTRICVVSVVGAAPSVIAIDGQPSELFQPARGTVPIGPGARFEMMVDLPAKAGASSTIVLRGEGEPDRTLMVLTTKGEPLPQAPPIARLAPNPLLPVRIPLERSIRRDVVLAAAPPGAAAKTPWLWTLNGVGSDGTSGPPLFVAKRGSTVTLAIVNKSALPQQMHIHGHVWRLLHDLDDGWDPYWRDSLLLAPGKTKHVAFIADNPGRWALCSSFADRQVTGLATWFHVT